MIIRDLKTLKEIAKFNNPYNTYVKALLNEKYQLKKKCLNEIKEMNAADNKFFDEERNQNIVTYSNFVHKRKVYEERKKEEIKLSIELSVWKEALDICSKAVDECKK